MTTLSVESWLAELNRHKNSFGKRAEKGRITLFGPGSYQFLEIHIGNAIKASGLSRAEVLKEVELNERQLAKWKNQAAKNSAWHAVEEYQNPSSIIPGNPAPSNQERLVTLTQQLNRIHEYCGMAIPQLLKDTDLPHRNYLWHIELASKPPARERTRETGHYQQCSTGSSLTASL